MQMLGKLGGKTKLVFYIFCPLPPPPLFKKRSRATAIILAIAVALELYAVLFCLAFSTAEFIIM